MDGVAAFASYEHAYALVMAHGEAGWAARLVPLTVDGLIYASSTQAVGSWRAPSKGPWRLTTEFALSGQ